MTSSKTGARMTEQERDAEFAAFKKKIEEALNGFEGHNGEEKGKEETEGAKEASKLMESLKRIYASSGVNGLKAELNQRCFLHILGPWFTTSDEHNQRLLADLRYPVEWYPEARALQRTIHVHVGPTNSGKTYQALQRLEAARTAVYAGPLRLLAHEVFSRLNARGKRCDLVTGDDQRTLPGEPAGLMSCTVEMLPFHREFDVAVIDEIQLMGDPQRGWAWTAAFLALQAKELHVCGEERAVPLIKHLANSMGDTVKLHTYERLSPLKTADRSLNNWLGNLREGDCLVAFSRRAIHSLKRSIQEKTGRKCAVIYGNLPPETRAEQAKLFNDPSSGYNVLVATDAIGMGLNLSIKRLIFTSLEKSYKGQVHPLSISHIKQIAGRAGRYRTANQDISPSNPGVPQTPKRSNVGLVTTLSARDLPLVRRAMELSAPPVASAGIVPPDGVIDRFSAYFPPETPLSVVMRRLVELCETNPMFHICGLEDKLMIADQLHALKNLTIRERLVFCNSPVALRDESTQELVFSLATAVSDQRPAPLLEISALDLELLDSDVEANRMYLEDLEELHRALILYLWLGYRFDNIFIDRALATHVKEMTEERISSVLEQIAVVPPRTRTRTTMRDGPPADFWRLLQRPSSFGPPSVQQEQIQMPVESSAAASGA